MYKWAVTSNGHICHMSKTYEDARKWAELRKGIYKIRPLTDVDFGSTAPLGIKS